MPLASYMLTKGRVNGPVFVEFLKRLMHNAPRPIFLILDGGSFHHSRAVRDYVDSLAGKLQLFFLTPSPRNIVPKSWPGPCANWATT